MLVRSTFEVGGMQYTEKFFFKYTHIHYLIENSIKFSMLGVTRIQGYSQDGYPIGCCVSIFQLYL